MTVQSHKDLIAWQKSIDLVAEIYEATKAFPKDEIYALTNQLRRAAVSVPSNIAEGQGRFSTNEFKHFLGNARGSLFEAQTQVVIATRLGYLSQEKADALLERSAEVARILHGLVSSLERQVVKE